MPVSPEKLQLLVEAGAAICSRSCGCDDLFIVILQSALHLLSCEAASLFLPQGSSGGLECVQHLGQMSSQAAHIATWVLQNGQPLIINDAKNEPLLADRGDGVLTLLSVVMKDETFVAGVIVAAGKAGNECFTAEDITSLEILGRQAAIAIKNFLCFKHYSLSATTQYIFSCEHKGFRQDFRPFIAKSPVMLSLLETINASSSSPILIIGECGSGKKTLARQVHLASSRRENPLVMVDCGEVDQVRLKEELFGSRGAFAKAEGGSVLLDEVGCLSVDLQEELLRIMEDRYLRLCNNESIPVDVRVIASTSVSLEGLLDHGTFLSSLYVRLNVLPLSLPPLRERREEILALADLFLKIFSRDCRKSFTGFSEAAKASLCAYMWPGNVRELENAVQRACILGIPPLIHINDLRLPSDASEEERMTQIKNSSLDYSMNSDRRLRRALNDFKREYLVRILEQTNWNQTKAARILKVQRTYVSKLINDLGIRR